MSCQQSGARRAPVYFAPGPASVRANPKSHSFSTPLREMSMFCRGASPGVSRKRPCAARMAGRRCAHLRLDVAVYDVVGVAEIDGTHQLPQHLLHVHRWQPVLVLLQVLQHRAVHKLKHQVQLALAGGAEHLDQVHNVLVLQRLRSASAACKCAAVDRRGGGWRTLRMRTSRNAVLRTCSSSSLSLKCLIATNCPLSRCRHLSTTPYVLSRAAAVCG